MMVKRPKGQQPIWLSESQWSKRTNTDSDGYVDEHDVDEDDVDDYDNNLRYQMIMDDDDADEGSELLRKMMIMMTMKVMMMETM